VHSAMSLGFDERDPQLPGELCAKARTRYSAADDEHVETWG
jgi:hypothetical protein